MASRLELQELLEALLSAQSETTDYLLDSDGKKIQDSDNKNIISRGIDRNYNVYYQPPESLKLDYPAIVYSKSRINHIKANDSAYLKHVRYDITVIDRLPDNPVIDRILELPYNSYDRFYKADNLNHDSLTLYY